MPEKTVEAWRNLWFHTGDALRRDEDGWYYFVDRYKDAIRRRGENISSYEVEQADPRATRPSPSAPSSACRPTRRPARTRCSRSSSSSGSVEAAEDRGLVRGPDPAFAIPRYLRIVDGAAEDAVGEGPQGRPARGRRHPRHL